MTKKIKLRGKFLSNIYDPKKPHAQEYLSYSHYAMVNGQRAKDREWSYHCKWIDENIIGSPKATATYTRSELEAQGMVGIYAPK